MKRKTSIVGVLCLLATLSFAQTIDVGASIGVSNFLGDLGKKEPSGRTYFGDLQGSTFKPAFSVFARNSFNYYFAMKGSFSYGVWEGDDRLANTKQFMDNAWFRNYRNLHFRSNVFELSIVGEVTPLKFIPGNIKRWVSPYFFTGIAMVYFNPKAEYNGEWVALQPLGTEGQGMSQYPDRQKYSRIQPAIPIGIGIKANINRYLTVGLELGHRFTFTDYLDDVSTRYVSEQEFIDFYGPEKGSLSYALSRRSHEIDPEESYGQITKPTEVRGNPGGKDNYLFTMLSVSYKFANNFSEFSYSQRRSPAKKKNIKKYRRFIKNKTW